MNYERAAYLALALTIWAVPDYIMNVRATVTIYPQWDAIPTIPIELMKSKRMKIGNGEARGWYGCLCCPDQLSSDFLPSEEIEA